MIYTAFGLPVNGGNATDAGTILSFDSSTRLLVLECGFALRAATATNIGLGRPAANGSGVVSSSVGKAMDPADPDGGANGQLVLQWTTPPTAPTNFLRIVQLTGTVGSAATWIFRRPLVCDPTPANIVFWNLAANAQLRLWVRWEIKTG